MERLRKILRWLAEALIAGAHARGGAYHILKHGQPKERDEASRNN